MRPASSIACGAAGFAFLVAAASVAGDGALQIGFSALLSSTGIALLAVAGAFLREGPVRASLGLLPPRLSAGRLVLLAVGLVGTSHLVDGGLRHLGLYDGSILEWFQVSLAGADGPGVAVAALGIGLAPGFAEELFFRGLLLLALVSRFGVPAGVLLSSALFGVVHLDFAQGLGAALLGLYLGAVAVAAGSTWAAVACHVVNNLTALAGTVWGGDPGLAGGVAAVVAAGLGGATLVGSLRAPGIHGERLQE
ncbi:MAG: type II CAAX endopeptidase family protein [Proteobacteria bacterium]|nr:type II CAAX endopeptidase family protein [Pseudomonadota bacterium]